MSMVKDFQSFHGPGDRDLKMTETEGYQPVSRIGEIVMNSYIDSYEWTKLPEAINKFDMGYTGNPNAQGADTSAYEMRPMFHEWASVSAGMIAVASKKRTTRNMRVPDTAVPVVTCAACMKKDDESKYYFAGVARSKSIPPPDDGMGPVTDEMFTLSLGGMVTCLNNSGSVIHAGDLVAWSFLNASDQSKAYKRAKSGPRVIALRVAEVSSDERIFGRALAFAKSGEPIDILLKQ